MNSKKKVPADFKPSDQVYNLADEHKIPKDFVNSCISEFIFYFQEKGVARSSWQRSFWNWVKKGWSYKQEQARKTVRTSPSSNQLWEAEQVEVADKSTAKQRIQDLKRGIYREH